MKYYKATRMNGTDFYSGTVQYTVGETTVHPDDDVFLSRDTPSTYLSISVEPTGTMLGSFWPCRLFEVEPIGDVADSIRVHSHKRAVRALRVLRELPAHTVFGPHGLSVVSLLDRVKTLTPDQVEKLHAVRTESLRNPAYDAAYEAAWGASCVASTNDAVRAAYRAALEVPWDVSWNAAGEVAGVATGALIVKDFISAEHFDILYGPWQSVMGD